MLLNKEQELNIIEYLKSNYSMPEKGIVAGQAVASLIYKELGLDLPLFINDVDVFTFEGEHTFSRLHTKSDDTSVKSVGQGSCHGVIYETKIKRGYKVLNSSYSEDDHYVNLIQIQYLVNGESAEVDDDVCIPSLIINSFDLNCCSVGFDLDTSKFYYTGAFIEFCRTKQLRVNSCHTPYHTMLRLMKKSDELKNVYCDIDGELNLLIASIAHSCIMYQETVIGNKFNVLYNKYKTEKIEKVFKLVESTEERTEKGLYVIETNHEYVEKLLESINKDFYSSVSYFSTSFVHLYHIHNDTGLFNDNYKKKYFKLMELDENKGQGVSLLTVMVNRELIHNPLNKINLDIKYSKLNQIFKMLKQHPLLFNIDLPKNINEALNVYRNIYKYAECKKDKKFLIGLLETETISIDEFMELCKLSKDEILEIVNKKVKPNNNIPPIKEMNLPFVKIKPLITVSDFAQEASEQEHCIFGYYKFACQNKDTAFYHLELNGKPISLYLNKGKIMQFYGFRNEYIERTFPVYLVQRFIEYKHFESFNLFYNDIIKKDLFNFKLNLKYKFNNNIHMYKMKKSLDNLFKPFKKNKTASFNNDTIPMDFDDDIPF